VDLSFWSEIVFVRFAGCKLSQGLVKVVSCFLAQTLTNIPPKEEKRAAHENAD
jgi:hypothetical protein